MKKHNQNGFAGLHLALILLVVALIGSVGWYVYHANTKTKGILNSSIKTSDSNSAKTDNSKTGSNIITVYTIPQVSNVANNASTPPNSTTNTTATVTPTPQPTQVQSYSQYMNITEWGVKVPTNSQYMGYRWDISSNNNSLISVFITDDTNGLYETVGCATGNIQGLYVFKDHEYSDYNSDGSAVMPDANLNVGGHVYYVYKSICQGNSASTSVENLADKVDLMSLK